MMKKIFIIFIFIFLIFISLLVKLSYSLSISGRLLDKYGDALSANISAYQQGTITNSSLTVDGNYSFYISQGTYDLNYEIFNFIPNFYVRLLSLSVISDVKDKVNNVTNDSNRISFSVDINNETVQTYSEKRPESVKANGTNLTEISSLSQLANNTWFYNSSEQKLYVNINPVVNNTTISNCSDGTLYGQCSSDKPKYCSSGTLTDKCSQCGCSAGYNCLSNESCNSTITADYYILGSSGTYTATNSSGQTILTDTNAAILINKVLNMMKSGQKVEFQGTFNMAGIINAAKSGTTLSFGTAVINGSSSIPTVGGVITIIYFSGLSNVTIDGGVWHGNGANMAVDITNSNSCTVQNGYFDGFTSFMWTAIIIFGTGNNDTVQYCTFMNNGDQSGNLYSAIAMNDINYARLLHNYVDTNNAGIGIWKNVYAVPGLGAGEIAYNYIKDWNTEGSTRNHAIYIEGAPDTIIHDNECTAHNATGVAIATKSLRTLIYNNYIHDVGPNNAAPNQAIAAFWQDIYGGTPDPGNPTGTRIYNNRIDNCGIGIEVSLWYPNAWSNFYIYNNTITNIGTTNSNPSKCAALHVVSEGHPDTKLSNMTFQDNVISNVSQAVLYNYGWIGDPNSVGVDGMKFLRNKISNVSYAGFFIIGYTASTNTTIAYNNLSAIGNPSQGILVDYATNTMVYNNTGLADQNVPPVKIPPP